jgi:hypothetical protein
MPPLRQGTREFRRTVKSQFLGFDGHTEKIRAVNLKRFR